MKIIELMAKPFVGDCIAIGHLQFLEACLGEDNEIVHSKVVGSIFSQQKIKLSHALVRSKVESPKVVDWYHRGEYSCKES